MSILRIVIAVIVAVVWAVVYLAAVFSGGHIHAAPELSGVMLAVVTWLFGTELRRSIHRSAKRVAERTDDRQR